MHLQFAYFESSMVVEYLIGRYGAAALARILDDLGEGIAINGALARNTEPLEKLDLDFAAWLQKQAEGLAPKANLEKPELPPGADANAIAEWNKDHPDNFWGLIAEGQAQIADRKWTEAKRALEKAIELYPNYDGAENPLAHLAAVHHALGETEEERAVLEKLADLDADAGDARLRLAEMASKKQDWKSVAKHAAAMLAINPLIAAPHQFLADAAEALGERSVAINANRALLVLQPLDRAQIHFRLARLLRADGKPDEAKRQAIEALVQAPRYLDAHRLLLEITREANKKSSSAQDTSDTSGKDKTSAAESGSQESTSDSESPAPR
jgi:tetratricopeptide (TPR) repeat protein